MLDLCMCGCYCSVAMREGQFHRRMKGRLWSRQKKPQHGPGASHSRLFTHSLLVLLRTVFPHTLACVASSSLQLQTFKNAKMEPLQEERGSNSLPKLLSQAPQPTVRRTLRPRPLVLVLSGIPRTYLYACRCARVHIELVLEQCLA